MSGICYNIGRFIAWVYLRLFFKIKVQGLDNIPKRKPFILCSNHINWMDPLTIGTTLPASYRIHFMAKQEIFNNFITSIFFRKLGAFPVKRKNADLAAIKTAYQLLKEGQVLGLFPEGSRSKTGRLQKAYNGAALIAVRSGVPIVPIAISGPYRYFKPVRMFIGEPFVLPPLIYENKEDKKEHLEEMSEMIMINIKKQLPQDSNK
ncbi:MAG: lysophospholipid acyltransferase family protein [Bacillota bacterium]